MEEISFFAAQRTKGMISASNDKVYAPMSDCFLDALLETDQSEIDVSPGKVISLIGQIALPCVCEVPPSSAPLFSPAGAKVVSQGITWQSLYLVILGRNFVLVEPDREASGDGRVVTLCPLERIALDRDPANARSDTSARRLLVSHRSHSMTPPGLFAFDDPPKLASKEGPIKRLRQWRSTLDVWFEDNRAVTVAFNKVDENIRQAKIHRGRQIQTYLAQDEGSKYPKNPALYGDSTTKSMLSGKW